jgi:sialidase-1
MRQHARSHTFGWLFAAAVIAAGVLVTAPAPAVADTTVTATAAQWSSSPFVSKPSKKVWYRIPAIIENAQGYLLAFAEKRDNDTSDMGDFAVAVCRSTNGGRTWSSPKTIADDGKNRVSNPVPVLDPQTGDVLLITSVRNANDTYKGIYLQRSTDGGSTFTSLAESRIKPEGSWKGGLTGPGHGIVLTQGAHAGRIVIALGYKTAKYYGAYGIYSDDGGTTWQTGYDQADTSGKVAYVEGTIAELPSGEFYIGYRDKNSTTPGKTRLYALSSDGGASLSTSFAAQSTLKIHSVEGSVLNPIGSQSGQLLFSSPTYTSAKDRSLRRDMGIFVSTDGGATWGTPYQVELESKPAAYSDLVQLNDSTVGILYETGTKKWRERIVFRQILMSEISDPTKVASSVKAALSAKTVTTSRKAKVKVVVAVKGIGSPAGKVSVNFTRTGKGSGSVTVTLAYSNKGKRYITLPKLKKGAYKVSVIYRGTSRIKAKTVSIGTLRVK